MRGVRSFVRREGRITDAQRRALALHAQRYSVADDAAPLDLDRLFGRRAPRWLEIGSGSGEALVAMACAHPEQDFLAAEVYRPGLGRLYHRLAAAGCANVRVVQTDAADLLERRLPAGAFDAVCIFFPDPWPKKRHHKRRLLKPRALAHLHRALAGHGRLYVATDSSDYAAEIGAAADGFVNLAGAERFALRPAWRVPTRFELKARAAGRPVHEFLYGRAR